MLGVLVIAFSTISLCGVVVDRLFSSWSRSTRTGALLVFGIYLPWLILVSFQVFVLPLRTRLALGGLLLFPFNAEGVGHDIQVITMLQVPLTLPLWEAQASIILYILYHLGGFLGLTLALYLRHHSLPSTHSIKP